MRHEYTNPTLADLLIAGLEFESGITSTMKASSGVYTVMITSSIAIRAFIYVWEKKRRLEVKMATMFFPLKAWELQSSFGS